MLSSTLLAEPYATELKNPEESPKIEAINYKIKRTYPSIIHNMHDIENMRAVVKKADINSKAFLAYKNLEAMSYAQADYEPCITKPNCRIGKANQIARPTDRTENWINGWEYDFYAMSLNAIIFAITGKQAHAEKVVELLNLYADTVISTGTGQTTPLAVGINMIHPIYAVDMIHSLSGETFKEGEYEKICKWIAEVAVLPETEVFYKTPAYTNGNWGAVVLMSYIALAVLLEDDYHYQRAIEQYLYSSTVRDNGTVLHYIDDNGQCQETGRDAAHSQLGVYALNMVAEIAWKNGTDLYSAYDYRLMKAFEYLAKFNMGYDDVPYKVWQDVTIKKKYSRWKTISQESRGNFRDVYELPYNHYVQRMGFEMPYTKELLESISPMTYPSPTRRYTSPTKYNPKKSINQADHFGFGAFLFMNDLNKPLLPY